MNNNCKNNNAMTIIKHRPHAGFASPFEELLGGYFGRDIAHVMGSDEAHPGRARVNIVENATSFKIHLVAPGYSKEQLKLNVEDKTLTISGEKQTAPLAEGERYTRREFNHNAFKRSFRLPDNVQFDAIKADHVNGVLTVSIPKTVETKPKSVDITIG